MPTPDDTVEAITDDDLGWVSARGESTRERNRRKARIRGEIERWLTYYVKHGKLEEAEECRESLRRIDRGELAAFHTEDKMEAHTPLLDTVEALAPIAAREGVLPEVGPSVVPFPEPEPEAPKPVRHYRKGANRYANVVNLNPRLRQNP